jgi:CheY-like chemotaxis protein
MRLIVRTIGLVWLSCSTGVIAQAQEPAAKPAPVVTDQVALDLLATNPTTPQRMMSVLTTLVDLREPKAVAGLLQKLIEANLDDEQLAKLQAEFGSAAFLKLALEPSLNPAANQFADKVLAAANKRAREPAHLAKLIEQLKNPSVDARIETIGQLQQGHEAAAEALLSVLADPTRSSEHANIRAALVALSADAVPGLAAAARSKESALAIQALTVLGHMRTAEAAIYLYVPAFAETSSPDIRAAAHDALALDSDSPPTAAAAAAILFTKAQAALAFDPQTTDPLASLARAFELAGYARAILPGSPEIRRLYFTVQLEAEAYRTGLDKPLPQGAGSAFAEIAATGTPVIEDLLADAISHEHWRVATACAVMLGNSGDLELLHNRGADPSLLVEATRRPDRRLRFAAVQAVLKLEPREAYPGSSFVADALEFFIAARGAPRAVVADLRAGVARQQAGLLASHGFEPDIAVDDRTLVKLAISSPDYELAMIDIFMAAPRSGELLAELRRDSRTARMPIAIIASELELGQAEALARRFRPAVAFVRPHQPASIELLLNLLAASRGSSVVPMAERMQQAEKAMTWLATLSQATQDLYDLPRFQTTLTSAVWVPELTGAACTVLGNVNMRESQRVLADLANGGTQPIDAREAAAAAFVKSVARHGILLTRGEILAQYDRYNASESEGKQVQALLGSMIDQLEARAARDGRQPRAN